MGYLHEVSLTQHTLSKRDLIGHRSFPSTLCSYSFTFLVLLSAISSFQIDMVFKIFIWSYRAGDENSRCPIKLSFSRADLGNSKAESSDLWLFSHWSYMPARWMISEGVRLSHRCYSNSVNLWNSESCYSLQGRLIRPFLGEVKQVMKSSATCLHSQHHLSMYMSTNWE